MSKDLIALLTVLAAAMWAGTWTLSPRYPAASVVRMLVDGSGPPLPAPIEVGSGTHPLTVGSDAPGRGGTRTVDAPIAVAYAVPHPTYVDRRRNKL
jgi:hypothetical protein